VFLFWKSLTCGTHLSVSLSLHRACLSARRHHVAATRPHRALKALSGPRASVPIAARIPTTHRRRPQLSKAALLSTPDHACPTCHATDIDWPLPPPPRRSPPSRACPRRRPRLTVRTPPSSTPPVSHGAVAFAAPSCHTRAAVYTTSSHRDAVHAPVRPRRALPRTASREPATSPPWSTRAIRAPPRVLRRARSHCTACTLAPSRAGPGHGPRTLH
jgi:hypothetical protein